MADEQKLVNQIVPHLFICSEKQASNILNKDKDTHNIHAYISLIGELEVSEKCNATPLILDINDNLTQDIRPILPITTEFIARHISNFKNVLVFCGAGVSRSGSIIIGYLMMHHRLDYGSALKLAQISRPIIQPNASFEFQLKCLEKYGSYTIYNPIFTSTLQKSVIKIGITNFAIWNNLEVYTSGMTYYLLTHIPTIKPPKNCVDIILSTDTASEIISAIMKIYDNNKYENINIACASDRILDIVCKMINIYLNPKYKTIEIFKDENDFGIISASNKLGITPIEYLKMSPFDSWDYGIAEVKKYKKRQIKSVSLQVE
jgi:hypothetical protein